MGPISARKLLVRGKHSGLRVVTIGEGGAGWFIAVLYSASERARFVGRGDNMLDAVQNAIEAFNAGHAVPREADQIVQSIIEKKEAEKEENRPRIILPN